MIDKADVSNVVLIVIDQDRWVGRMYARVVRKNTQGKKNG